MTKKKSFTLKKDVNLRTEVILDANGRRITEARVRALIRTTQVQLVGRPSLTAVGQHSPEVKARVPLKLKKTLQREAKRQGKTCSELVREALEEYLTSA